MVVLLNMSAFNQGSENAKSFLGYKLLPHGFDSGTIWMLAPLSRLCSSTINDKMRDLIAYLIEVIFF